MKTKNWILLLGTVLYMYLFYKQNAGINTLVYALLTGTGFVYARPGANKSAGWWMVAILHIYSAICVFIHNSDLALMGYVFTLLAWSALTFNPYFSIIPGLLASLKSVVGAPFYWIRNLYRNRAQFMTLGGSVRGKSVLTILIPLVIAFLFFFLYKQANPLFNEYTRMIQLDFITVQWVFFLVLSFFVTYGLLNHQPLQGFNRWELALPARLSPSETKEAGFNEYRAFLLLLVLLNAMLVFINLLDVQYLYLGAGMPAGLTHKAFVHKGVDNLVLSIALGISVLLFFFRSGLNFHPRGAWLRNLAYVWMAQNLLMMVSTAMRNQLYINAALLTYKRIGVYYWLFFAAAGLIFTAIKLKKLKPAWYLMREGARLAMLVMVLSGSIDWDLMITRYNLNHSDQLASLDKKYLLSLASSNLPELYSIRNKEGFNVDSSYSYRYYGGTSNVAVLDKKAFYCLGNDSTGWQSYGLRHEQIKRDIQGLIAAGALDSLDLSALYYYGLKRLKHIPGLNALVLDESILYDSVHCKTLAELPNLKTISFTALSRYSAKFLNQLKHIPTIRILKVLEYGTLDTAFKYNPVSKIVCIDTLSAYYKKMPISKNP